MEKREKGGGGCMQHVNYAQKELEEDREEGAVVC